jgi:hypothetical protein
VDIAAISRSLWKPQIKKEIKFYVTYVMLCILHSMIGDSGRIVVEVEPDLKRRLYSALALEHQSLKDWFIDRATEYVRSQQQPDLFRKGEGDLPRY